MNKQLIAYEIGDIMKYTKNAEKKLISYDKKQKQKSKQKNKAVEVKANKTLRGLRK